MEVLYNQCETLYQKVAQLCLCWWVPEAPGMSGSEGVLSEIGQLNTSCGQGSSYQGCWTEVAGWWLRCIFCTFLHTPVQLVKNRVVTQCAPWQIRNCFLLKLFPNIAITLGNVCIFQNQRASRIDSLHNSIIIYKILYTCHLLLCMKTT